MKKAILLVSHSQKVTDSVKEMITDMSPSADVWIFSLGGLSSQTLGSDPTRILSVITTTQADVFLLFADVGSSLMNAELAYDLLEPEKQKCCYLMDAPLVEGAFAAAVTASASDDLHHIIQEAQDAGKKGWNRNEKDYQ